MRSRPRLGRSGALALALLACGGAAVAAEAPRLTTVTRATAEDLAPARTYTSPYLIVDPDDDSVVLGAAGELRSRTCRLLRSNDAGQTWKLLDAVPSPASYPFCTTSSGMLTQTPLAFGRNRTLYYAMSGWDTQDGGPNGNVSVVLAQSADLGENWTSSIVRDARGKSGPQTENHSAVASLAVDTKTAKDDIVYVGWRASYPFAPPFPGGLRAHRPPLIAVSTDAGKTFSDPVDVSSFHKKTSKGPDGSDLPLGMGFTAPSIAVDDAGALYVLYPAASAAAFPPTSAPAALPMLLAKSTDRGKTFTFTEVGKPLTHNEGVQVLRWSPQGGSQGTLHMIFEDKPDQTAQSADRDIYYQRSTDGGKTFTDPRKLNDDDPRELRVQVTPNLTVAPDGRIDAVWWDFRNDPGTFVNDVYATSSTDNGETWSTNLRITDRSVNRKLGVWSNGYDIRQPPGLASTNSLAVMAWDDTRLGNQITETQDIFARDVQFKALGTSDAPARYVLAAFAGLAVVGVVLLVATGWRRRSELPPQPASNPQQAATDAQQGPR
ncbi:MAG: sialidase family protein [Acidimicrobiales bacterium]|nr:sialidase family protein [Acidimicrobiales bacterium]